MPINVFSPPSIVQDELKGLRAYLDAAIPAKKLDRNIMICTWNIRMFGQVTMSWEADVQQAPKRDAHSLLSIVEIIKRFDVIMIQEIRGNYEALKITMRLLGKHWKCLLTPINFGSKGNDERIGYIFDVRKVELLGYPSELVFPDEVLKKYGKLGEDSFNLQFMRTPFKVCFKVANNTVFLLTLHLLFGNKSIDRVAEMKVIADWIARWAKELASNNISLITLGDFNFIRRGDPTFDAFISSGLYVPDDMQKVDRTLFSQTYSFYDQIAWFEGSIRLIYSHGGIVDFRNHVLINRNYNLNQLSYRISDHFPLWAEFQTK